MKRIVVGADGSAGSSNAMRWASRLAWAHGAEVVVMTGFVPTDSELPPSRYQTLLARTEEDLKQWSDAAHLGEVPVRTIVERGDARPGILNVARREEADLIVVGRSGRSAGPGFLHIGSLAEWLAHNSDRPVAIVGGAVNTSTRSALVGVDGSPGSHAALAWVAELAACAELRVVAASVSEPIVEWSTTSSRENWRRGLEKTIREEMADELNRTGVDYTALALSGTNVADALLRAAQDERTDIVVVGMRGLGGFTQLRIGGVALKVLHRSDRPVVLVPPIPAAVVSRGNSGAHRKPFHHRRDRRWHCGSGRSRSCSARKADAADQPPEVAAVRESGVVGRCAIGGFRE